MTYLAPQIRKSGASTAANPAAAHSEPHITPHGRTVAFPVWDNKRAPGSPPAAPSERLPVRPGHTRSGMHSIYVRRPELRFALRSPCICCCCASALVPLRCCPPPASLCKNRLGGVLFSCIWSRVLVISLSVLYFLSGGLLVWWSCYIAVLSLLRRRDTPYPILYHLAN